MTLEPVLEAEPVPPLEETELIEDAGGLVSFSILFCKYACTLTVLIAGLLSNFPEIYSVSGAEAGAGAERNIFGSATLAI
jgi:hypothetical protein